MGLSVKITARGDDSGFTLGELRQLVQHARGVDDEHRVALTVTRDRFDSGDATLSLDLDQMPTQPTAGLQYPPGVRGGFADQRDAPSETQQQYPGQER